MVLHVRDSSDLSRYCDADDPESEQDQLVTLVTTEPGAGEDPEPEAREQGLRMKRASLAALPPKRYPLITGAADTLICPASTDRYYALGINLVVAGIRGVLTDLEG